MALTVTKRPYKKLIDPSMRHFIITLILALCAAAGFAQDIDNGYVIDQYRYHAQVHANNSWTVTEELDVTFLEPRHGIYRHIPRIYCINRRGVNGSARYTYRTTVDEIDIPGEDVEIIENDDSQDDIILRIGNEHTVHDGPHSYTIRYTLQKPDDRWAGGDELFHTVLGPQCNTTIGHFEFRIAFDKPLPTHLADELSVQSGPYGSEQNRLDAQVSLTGGCIVGSADSIEPFQGISIFAPMEEGYWQGAPSPARSKLYILLAVTALLFLWLVYYCMTHHRYRPTIVYEYSAPEGLSSAEVGTIIDDSADLSDLTSLVVWWASKGYVKIVEKAAKDYRKTDTLELVKLAELPKTAPQYQKAFWRVFFTTNDSANLNDLGDKHTEIATAKAALKHYFKGERSLTKLQFKPFLAWLLFVALGTLAFASSSAVADFDPDIVSAAVICFAAPTVLMGFTRIVGSARDMLRGHNARTIRGFVYVALAAANVWFFAEMFYNAADSYLPLEVYGVLIAAGWMTAFFAGDLISDSAYRLHNMSLLLGFREFLEKSELPMLKAQVDENPNFFYDILPYAMVFGLSDKWSKQFAALNIAPPTWYETQGTMLGMNPGLNFNAAHFAQHLTTDFSKSISKSVAAASIDPTQANNSGGGFSGGGGGFSGGGGGGGGVGSW